MVTTVLFCLAGNQAALPQRNTIDLLSENAKSRAVTVFARIPDWYTSYKVPTRVDEIPAAFYSDWQTQNGDTLCLTQSSSEDLRPKDDHSLEWTNRDCLHSARTAVKYFKFEDNTGFVGKQTIDEIPGPVYKTYFNAIGLNSPSLIEGGIEHKVGDPGTHVEMWMWPNLQVKDKNTGATAHYVQSETAKTVVKPESVYVARTYSLDAVRDKSMQPFADVLRRSTLSPGHGIYNAQSFVRQISDRAGIEFSLPENYSKVRLLIVSDRPLSCYEALSDVLRSCDLYIQDQETRQLGPAPTNDANRFIEKKLAAEEHNYSADILEAAYAKGLVPNFVPPDAFFNKDAGLWTPPQRAALTDFLVSAKQTWGQTLPRAKSAQELSRYDIECTLQISLQLKTQGAQISRQFQIP